MNIICIYVQINAKTLVSFCLALCNTRCHPLLALLRGRLRDQRPYRNRRVVAKKYANCMYQHTKPILILAYVEFTYTYIYIYINIYIYMYRECLHLWGLRLHVGHVATGSGRVMQLGATDIDGG